METWDRQIDRFSSVDRPQCAGPGGWPADAVCWRSLPAVAGGPIETSVFAVQGVDVDVTSTDATTAKNQALMDVQVKAFFSWCERLGTPELAAEAQAKLKPEDIAPYLRSLSIEQETSAPGRYIGKFTVRFLPDKMQKYFRRLWHPRANPGRLSRFSSCRCGAALTPTRCGKTMPGARPGSISRASRHWCRSSCRWAISRIPRR